MLETLEALVEKYGQEASQHLLIESKNLGPGETLVHHLWSYCQMETHNLISELHDLYTTQALSLQERTAIETRVTELAIHSPAHSAVILHLEGLSQGHYNRSIF